MALAVAGVYNWSIYCYMVVMRYQVIVADKVFCTYEIQSVAQERAKVLGGYVMGVWL